MSREHIDEAISTLSEALDILESSENTPIGVIVAITQRDGDEAFHAWLGASGPSELVAESMINVVSRRVEFLELEDTRTQIQAWFAASVLEHIDNGYEDELRAFGEEHAL